MHTPLLLLLLLLLPLPLLLLSLLPLFQDNSKSATQPLRSPTVSRAA
jgi:hypothetical protein